MPRWTEQLTNENALISLRAEQMIHLTGKGKPRKDELVDVLRMTLDHVVVCSERTLLIILLDGTYTAVDPAMPQSQKWNTLS